MTTRISTWISSVLSCLLLAAGCATVQQAHPPLGMDPVMPYPGEAISPHHVVVLADASGSMSPAAFPVQQATIHSFVEAMPIGEYGAAIDSFGGADQDAWLWNSLDWFKRERLLAQAASLKYIGGITPLAAALTQLQSDLAGRGRSYPGALVVFSDGRVRSQEACVAAAQDLVRLHGAWLCIYTVQLGYDAGGRATLEAIAQTAPCGAYFHLDEISTPGGMENFVRTVFFRPEGMRDSDGDGVPDHLDQCPNTPRGARVDSRGCWVIEGLNFDFDKSDIKPEFEPLLEEVASVLRQNPGVRIRVDGHTDSDGSHAYNQALSERRAESVRRALENRGVGAAIVAVQGFGESQPAVPNTSAANKYRNRRVELTALD